METLVPRPTMLSMPTSPPDWCANSEDLAEAKAGTFADGFGREKWFEGTIEHFGSHSAAGIGDADLQIMAGSDVTDLVGSEFGILCRNPHQSLAKHGVAGIDREIDDRVFELMRVDVDRPGILCDIDLNPNPLAKGPVEKVGHSRNRCGRNRRVQEVAARTLQRRGGAGSKRPPELRLPLRC